MDVKSSITEGFRGLVVAEVILLGALRASVVNSLPVSRKNQRTGIHHGGTENTEEESATHQDPLDFERTSF